MAKTILVVEDDIATLRLFVDALSAEGFGVYPERNGAAAIRTFEEKHPDAVILDLLVPGRNGFQIAEQIRRTEMGSKTPIILITGIYKSATHKTDAELRYKVVDYLVKPIRVEALYASLRRVFGAAYPTKPAAHPMRAAARPASGTANPVVKPNAAAAPSRAVSQSPQTGLTMSDLALAGDLARRPFAELLHPIYRARATGALLVSRDRIKKIVYVQKGFPVIVRSNVLAECLGRVMVAERIITEADCDKSIELVRETGRLQGAILLEMGVISPQNLKWSLERQLERKLFDLFSWQRGEYRFSRRGEFPSTGVALGHSPAALVYEGAKRSMSPARLIGLLSPQFDSFPRRVDDPLVRFQEMELDQSEKEFVRRIDGRRTLRKIVSDLELGTERTVALIYALISAGMVECIADAQTKARSPIDSPEVIEVVPRPSADRAAERLALVEFVESAANRDYFELLGVKRDASVADLKRAHLKLARDFHPDRFAASPPDIRELASSAYTIISTALSTLEDPNRRAEYIATLDLGPNPEAAVQQVQALLKAEVEFQRGEAFLRSKRPREALDSFLGALRLYPDEAEHHVMVGWAMYQSSPADIKVAHDAQEHIKRGLQMNPKLDIAHVFLGSIYRGVENRLAAEAAFAKALEINPDNKDAQRLIKLINRGRSEERSRRR